MQRYPAKLLLFGEHVLLLGAPALSVPVETFGGHWEWHSPDTPMRELDLKLLEFARSPVLRGVDVIDTEALENDLGLGLYFDSNIPTGYGLGSSGALVAAVYDRYAKSKSDDPQVLKQIFARMEAYFHGHSSGIDPLTSYLGKAVKVREIQEVETVQQQDWAPHGPVVFLLDSALPRHSGPMIQWFQTQAQKPDFFNLLKNRYLPDLEETIGHWLEGELDPFLSKAAEISAFQFEHFSPLIPESVREIWARALARHKNVHFKLCGAGGGGFVLGFAATKEEVRFLADHHPLIFPFEKNRPHE
ncbi:MAG: hypothetical protein JNL02_13085 [Saprospiraceae bacterium]|nr:hypothetical protein [Saprospiraceae bacterium]